MKPEARSKNKFEKLVLEKIKKINRGRVTTYKILAEAIGHPRAWRAVGNALNKNPHPVRIPCHRVIKSNGEIGGYALGTKKKVKYLRAEGVIVIKGKVKDYNKILYNFKNINEKCKSQNLK